MSDYVESIKDVPELVDMVSAPKAAADDKIVYEEVIEISRVYGSFET